MLANVRVVDLTQPFGPETVVWPGTPEVEVDVLFNVSEHGFYGRKVLFWEHTGTHFDAPAHFHSNVRTTGEFTARDLVVPAVVIDISARCAEDPDAVLEPSEIEAWEAEYGTIPEGCCVLLYTGWDAHRTNAPVYAGEVGAQHFPGFGVAAAEILCFERKVAGLGIDTLGIDPGAAATFPIHANVSLKHDGWHLEGLINLGELPPTGSWIVVGALLLSGGSGTPARVIAFCPPEETA